MSDPTGALHQVDAAKQYEIISPAADVAVALARLLRGDLARGEAYYAEAGGLGFGYTAADGQLAIVVDWQGTRCLQVVAHEAQDFPRIVQPFNDGGEWIREMRDSLRDLQQVVAARRPPAGHATRN
jgi:hypothetical protein